LTCPARFQVGKRPFAVEPPIRTAADLEAVAAVFDCVRVTPNPQGYDAFRRRVGEQGLAIARGVSSASPMHMIMHELCRSEQFFYLYADEYAALRRLADHIAPYYEAVLDCVAGCAAEAVTWGANYDQNLTWPAFFERDISPWLQKVGTRLHGAGKYLVSHCDGENEALTDLLASSGIDMAESICPAPMTKLSLAELRHRWHQGVGVFGGIPSVALLPDVFDDSAYTQFISSTFEALGSGEHLILGVADMVPADVDLRRLEDIGRRVQAFGPIPAAR
jgi:hypothetical protein